MVRQIYIRRDERTIMDSSNIHTERRENNYGSLNIDMERRENNYGSSNIRTERRGNKYGS